MSAPIRTVKVYDDDRALVATITYTERSGWLWTCARCPTANTTTSAHDSASVTLATVELHIECWHP